LVGEQHIGCAGLRRHFRLGNGGTLEAGEAQRELVADHLRKLMGLEVRPEPFDSTRHADHPPQVLLDAIRIEQERRDGIGAVADDIPREGASEVMVSQDAERIGVHRGANRQDLPSPSDEEAGERVGARLGPWTAKVSLASRSSVGRSHRAEDGFDLDGDVARKRGHAD
jgi:hypothetical protein